MATLQMKDICAKIDFAFDVLGRKILDMQQIRAGTRDLADKMEAIAGVLSSGTLTVEAKRSLPPLPPTTQLALQSAVHVEAPAPQPQTEIAVADFSLSQPSSVAAQLLVQSSDAQAVPAPAPEPVSIAGFVAVKGSGGDMFLEKAPAGLPGKSPSASAVMAAAAPLASSTVLLVESGDVLPSLQHHLHPLPHLPPRHHRHLDRDRWPQRPRQPQRRRPRLDLQPPLLDPRWSPRRHRHRDRCQQPRRRRLHPTPRPPLPGLRGLPRRQPRSGRLHLLSPLDAPHPARHPLRHLPRAARHAQAPGPLMGMILGESGLLYTEFGVGDLLCLADSSLLLMPIHCVKLRKGIGDMMSSSTELRMMAGGGEGLLCTKLGKGCLLLATEDSRGIVFSACGSDEGPGHPSDWPPELYSRDWLPDVVFQPSALASATCLPLRETPLILVKCLQLCFFWNWCMTRLQRFGAHQLPRSAQAMLCVSVGLTILLKEAVEFQAG